MFKLSSKLFLTFFSIFGAYSSISAQVNVTATGAAPAGIYTTLKTSFDSINSGYHQGVITITLTGNTSETASAVLNASGSGLAQYTSVNISATTPVTISGTITGSIIRLLGADNVTIDGRIGGMGQNITIQNNSTATATAAIWLSSTGAAAGATKNIIRNLNISCGVTQNTSTLSTFGIIMSGTTISTTSAGSDNDSNQFIDNRITRVRYGIVTRGEGAANLNEATFINQNIIGPSSYGADQIGKVGLFTQFENNCNISYNTIQFVGGNFSNTTAGADRVGIAMGAESWTPTVQINTNYRVHHNVIHDVVDERTFSAIGILHAAGNSGLPTNHQIYNNFIYNVHANGTATDQGVGIGISAGANDLIVHNSISMTEGDIDPPGTTTASQSNAGIRISSATPIDLTLKNNIINVDLSSNTGTLNHYCIVAPSTTFPWGTGGLDHNNYFINSGNPQMRIGGTGTAVPYAAYLTLANWKTNFSATQDLNTQNVNPNFISPTNLHITGGLVSNLESKAVVIPAIINDIDNDVRPGPAGSVNGGALAPDIGADEFDGIPLLLDVGISVLVDPVTSGCHSATDSVKVRLINYSIQTINFGTDAVTINSSVTGTNPQVFAPVIINSGTLAPLATIDVMVAPVYDMSATGGYTFNANATVVGDGNTPNDAMAPITINISGGTASSSNANTCHLDPVTLTVSGNTNGGTVQWQYFSSATSSWTNYPSGNVNPFTTLLNDSTDHFRALTCGVHTSNEDSVQVTFVAEPVANDVTRCGAGSVTLNATGSGLISWYDAPVGGTLIDTGATFVTNVVSSTNFYVQAGSGFGNQSIGAPTNGQNTGYTLEAGLFFDVFAPSITIQGVYVYPVGTGPGTIDIAVKDNLGIDIQVVTINLVGTTAPGIQTYVPLNFTVPSGTNYSLVMLNRTGGVANLVRDASASITGGGFPFTLPGIMSITTGRCCPSAVSTSYYYFYDWQIATGCASERDTVTVTVTPSDTITATIVTNPICSNTTTDINISSVNPNYQYTWLPAAGLNTTVGANVTSSSDTTITYTINAFDPGTTCEAYTFATVNVNTAPSINITTSDTFICINSTLQIDGLYSAAVNNTGTIGFNTTNNTATSTTILGPYGGLYGGAKHQYLFTAADLTGAGLSAGPISQIAFEVVNINGVPALDDYTIKMDTTSLTALTVGYAPANQTVYYNSSYTPTTGWNTHTFDNNFLWDGVSGLIVEVCFNNNDAGTASGNASVRYSATTGTNTVNYYRANNDPNVCGMLSGTPGVNRPNIRLSTVSPVTLQWSPIANLSNDTIINPILTAVSSGLSTITITDNINGCFETDDISVTVNPLPVFNIGNDTLVCSNLTLTPFPAFASDNTLNYLWFDGAITTGTLITSTGTFWATGTDANGCSSTDTITVGTLNPATVDIDINVTGTNTANLDAGAGYSTYLWSNSATTQTTTVTGNGTYFVQITDANGCPNADTVSIVFSLGIDENDNSTLSFYPNPSTGIINMAGTGLNGKPLKVEIMSISGQMVYQQNIEEPGENFIQQIDLSAVAEGTYVVRVINEQRSYTSRIVIVKN